MPRGRMLNKKISIDDKVNSLSIKSMLIFTWMIPHLDCEGRIMAVPDKIKYEIFPINKGVSTKNISESLKEMQEKELVVLYGENNVYCQFLGFEKNQKIDKNREAQSMIPPPTQEQLTSNSGVTHELNPLKEKFKVNVNVKVKGVEGQNPAVAAAEVWDSLFKTLTPNESVKANAILDYLESPSCTTFKLELSPKNKTGLIKLIRTFPNTDILKEIKKADNWLFTSKKHRTDYMRFITNWLNRADRG